jgi:hypothetical protein
MRAYPAPSGSFSKSGVTAGKITQAMMKYGIVAAAQMPRILAREYWEPSSFAFQAVGLEVVVLFISCISS